MQQSTRLWITLAAAVALIAATATPAAWAVKLDDAEIYIEINATDGDAGIHVFLDGEGWDLMEMTGPNGTEFAVMAENSVGQQGITEFFFESAEPSFEEQTLEELLELFPEGIYRFRGKTTEGRNLKGRAELTHALPDAPVQTFPVGGESVDPDNAVFTWDEVPDPDDSEIDIYQIVVECERPGSEMAVEVPADVTQITVPPEVLDGQRRCKWEVLAVEESGNRTISETPFKVD